MNFTILLGAALVCAAPEPPTTLDGAALALRASGTACDDGAWRLDGGFAGAYIRLSAPGEVTFVLRAAKGDSQSGAAGLRLRVADFVAGWPVAAAAPAYERFEQTWKLPAGTYCVRIENAANKTGEPRPLQIRDLSVSGAALVNEATDALALEAADTYVERFRKGAVGVVLTADGQPLARAEVRIRLKNHAFLFGTALAGAGRPRKSRGTGGGDGAMNYADFVRCNFNAVVPENAGKWGYNEAARGQIALEGLDRIIDFAEASGKRVRMHGVLWDVSEPAWVDQLQDAALHGSDPSQRDAAKAELRAAISERIRYFVAERARRYDELDVLNEGVHRPMYYDIFGVEGVAGIYSEVKAAVAAAGASTRIVPNEYDVFQSLGKIGDPYANWYRRSVEALRGAGGAVDGIGIQYYALDNAAARARNPHSPARMAQVMHNLAATGLPLTLSEFGVQRSGEPTPQRAAEILADALRLCFGHDRMTGFISWGFLRTQMWSVAPMAALVDADWNLTPAGKVWQQMTGIQDWKEPGLPCWTTDVRLTTDAQGRVDFTGFYGDYELSVGSRHGAFSLVKGEANYHVETAQDVAGESDSTAKKSALPGPQADQQNH